MKHPPFKAFITRFGIVAVLFLQAACHRHFTPTGRHTHTNHQVDSTIAADPDILAYYEPYKRQLTAEMDRVVGHTDVDLTHPKNAPETLLGNFFADALLTQGRTLHPEAEFSFGTKGGLRIELQQGPITIGKFYELMPFENELVLLEITGDNVFELAKFIASKGGQPISGLRMSIVNGQPADIRIADKPIIASQTYKLITYDYLANGGDYVQGLERPIKRIDLGVKVRESLIDYVGAHTSKDIHIATQLDGRITRIQ